MRPIKTIEQAVQVEFQIKKLESSQLESKAFSIETYNQIETLKALLGYFELTKLDIEHELYVVIDTEFLNVSVEDKDNAVKASYSPTIFVLAVYPERNGNKLRLVAKRLISGVPYQLNEP